MGIFDFLKDSGDTRGIDSDGEQMQELRTGNTIIRKIRGLGLSMDGVEVDFDDGVATLRGQAADQRTRELMVLTAGNTPGVRRVDDRLTPPGGPGLGRTLDGNTYTVQKGDTLSEIAEEHLGDASKWREIYEANTPMLDDPDKIYPGQVLRLP